MALADDSAEALAEGKAIAVPLGLALELPPPAGVTETRHFYDLSGRVVIDEMHRALPATRATERVVSELRGVLEDNPGASEVRVRLQEPGRTTLMQLDKRLSVTPSAALYASLKTLLGPSCLQ